LGRGNSRNTAAWTGNTLSQFYHCVSRVTIHIEKPRDLRFYGGCVFRTSSENKAARYRFTRRTSLRQRTIDDFWTKIRKYQPHLREGGTESCIKDSWVKIKWAVCKKDDLERFKADLRGHRGAIAVLLLALQMAAATIQTKRIDEGQKMLAGSIQEFSSQWLSRLSVVADTVGQAVQQGKMLLKATAEITQTNLRVFHMMLDIHQFVFRVPSQVSRQQPVYMTDALGKESPFHLEFVRSAEALIAILKVNFRSTRTGPRMIEQGEFMIEDDATKKHINLASDWETCSSPGQRVSMSMVLHRGGFPLSKYLPELPLRVKISR